MAFFVLVLNEMVLVLEKNRWDLGASSRGTSTAKIQKEIFLKHGVTESTEPRRAVTRRTSFVKWDRKHIFVVIDIQQVLVD